MTVVVIAVAIVASAGLCVLWERAVDRIVARQQRQEAERLRQERRGEPPVLGGAQRRRRAGGRLQ